MLLKPHKKLVFILKLSQFNFYKAFFVHELSPLVFKIFSTTLHFSVMIQMILALINTFQILNINLLMNLKF